MTQSMESPTGTRVSNMGIALDLSTPVPPLYASAVVHELELPKKLTCQMTRLQSSYNLPLSTF